MEIRVRTRQREYPIYIGSGILESADKLRESKGKIFIISDSGVPARWQELLSERLNTEDIYVFSQGEINKNMRSYEGILNWLAERRASRKDTIAAIGGGVVGDMAGFAAATYMRGIEYINIPTTTLSMIDSGIGGKTAIDLNGIKNIVGAFWQPAAVIIDTDTLETLPARQVRNGLAEAVKSGLIGDPGLFEMFEKDDYMDHINEIIRRSLEVKRRIVEADENESSVRKLLNLGHTYGHAYESLSAGRYLHGECVAMGMMTIIKDEEIRGRLRDVLARLGLPYEWHIENSREASRVSGPDDSNSIGPGAVSGQCDAARELSMNTTADSLVNLIMNDKKASAGYVDVAQVNKIGSAHIETWSIEDVRQRLCDVLRLD